MTNQILDYLDHVEITHSDEDITVAPVWRGVDRVNIGGIALKPSDIKTAERLKLCMESGKAFDFTGILRDVNDETYVGYNSRVFGRTLKSDLKRLGY